MSGLEYGGWSEDGEDWFPEPEAELLDERSPFTHWCDDTCYLIDGSPCARCGMRCHNRAECPRLA